MDIAPDTPLMAMPALSAAAGASSSVRNSPVKTDNIQSFNAVFGSHLSSIAENQTAAVESVNTARPVLEVPATSALPSVLSSELPGEQDLSGETDTFATVNPDPGNVLPLSGMDLPLDVSAAAAETAGDVDDSQEIASSEDEDSAQNAPLNTDFLSVNPAGQNTNSAGQGQSAAALATAFGQSVELRAHVAERQSRETSIRGASVPTFAPANANVAEASEHRINAEASAERGQVLVPTRAEEGGSNFRPSEIAQTQIGAKPEFSLDSQAGGDSRQFIDSAIARLQDQPPGLQNLLTNSSVKAAPVQLNTHMLNDPTWPDAFGERINWLIGKGEQSATIQLAPESLGKLQLRITVSQGVTHLEVHARNQHTAELMESMLPRLQSSLESHGIRMDEVKFSQQPFDTGREFSNQFAQHSSRDSSQNPSGQSSQHPHSLDAEGQPLASPEMLALQSGLLTSPGVDYYA